MPRRRHHSRRGTATASLGSGISKFIRELATPVSFIQQITEKDQTILSANRPTVQKLKDIANIVTGRMTGFHLFNSKADYKPKFTLNPAGIANKWVGAGIGMIVYGQLAKRIKILPKGGMISGIGKRVLIGGAVGGLFDAPNGNGDNGNYVAPEPVEYQSNTYSQGNRYLTNGYVTSSIPKRSAFD